MTEQELKVLMGLGDVSGQEDTLAQQMALADHLRGNVIGIQGGLTGGNIARAAYGTAAAMKDYQNKGRMANVNKDRTAAYAAILASMNKPKKSQAPLVLDSGVKANPYGDPTGDLDENPVMQ